MLFFSRLRALIIKELQALLGKYSLNPVAGSVGENSAEVFLKWIDQDALDGEGALVVF